tara:strand:- start:292 stop:651 length:360 start_codon:yes stop_codon:yes gene_type:complete
MFIKLKLGDLNFKVSSENHKKIMDFAGMFFDPEIKVQEIRREHIYVSDDDIKNMTDKELEAIRKYCQSASLSDFQTYESLNDIPVSMSGEDISAMTHAQHGLQDLINKSVNKPKVVASS